MAISIKHKFQSQKEDGDDEDLVKPSDWNDEHDLTLGQDKLLGRASSGTGPVEEIDCTAAGRALLDDNTAAEQRATLGLGSIATQAANNVNITGGSISGITDLAIADGGTGASTAADAFNNLKQNATTSATGVVEKATAEEVHAATADKYLAADHLETAAEPVGLSDGSTVAIDWTAGINFTLTVAGNRTLGNPTNEIPGTWRTVLVQGDSGTERTLSFGNEYGGAVPTLEDITSTKKYLLMIYCKAAGQFLVTAIDGSDA